MTRNLQILDSTLREGIQAVHSTYPLRGIVFSKKQSESMAKLLFTFGIDYLEVGSPVCSIQSRNTIASIIRMSRNYKTQVLIHCRLLESDANEALSCHPDGLNFYFNSSSFSKFSPNDVVAKAVSVFDFVRTKSKSVSIRFSFEDAFRTPYPTIRLIILQLSKYVDRFGFPDTTGLSSPEQVSLFTQKLSNDFPTLISEFHFHNDRGLATANARASLIAGASIIDTTILGLGERNGIVSLTGLISALLADKEYRVIIQKKYNLTSLFSLHKYMSKILNIPIYNSEPIVSLGYFVQSAGVHVNGNQISEHMYESYNPSDFGLRSRYCWASGVVGKTNMMLRAKDLGLKIDSSTAQQLAASIRERAKEKGSIQPSYVDRAIKKFSK